MGVQEWSILEGRSIIDFKGIEGDSQGENFIGREKIFG